MLEHHASPVVHPSCDAIENLSRVMQHENGTGLIPLFNLNGGFDNVTPTGFVEHLIAECKSLREVENRHAAKYLGIGFALVQAKSRMPHGVFERIYAQLGLGLHLKRAQEMMRVARFFTTDEGRPNLALMNQLGFIGEDGKLVVKWNKMFSYVREQTRCVRAASGTTAPGKAITSDELAAYGDEENDDLTPEEEALAGLPVRFDAPMTMQAAVQMDRPRVELQSPHAIPPFASDGSAASDMQSGSNRHTGIGVRAGIASEPTVVAGSGPRLGGVTPDRSFAMAEGKDRGAAGAQVTMQQYMEEVMASREAAIKGIELLTHQINTGIITVDDGAVAMAEIAGVVKRFASGSGS